MNRIFFFCNNTKSSFQIVSFGIKVKISYLTIYYVGKILNSVLKLDIVLKF